MKIETMFIFVLFFITVCSVVILNFTKIKRWNRMRIQLNKLKGRKGIPVFGNIMDVMGDRKTIFRNLMNSGAEFISAGIELPRSWLLHIGFVTVFKPEDLETIMSSTIPLTKGVTYRTLLPWLGNGLLTSSGQLWHTRRKILTPAFHFKILQRFLKTFNTESEILVKNLMKHANEEHNIIPTISKFTLNSICETSMGITLDSMDGGSEYYRCIYEMGNIFVKRISNPWMMVDFFFYLTPSYWRQRKLLKYLHGFSSDVIRRRKIALKEFLEKEGQDFEEIFEKKKFAMLDILLLAQRENGEIDDTGIREEVDTFMFEGHDTTSLALSYLLMLLANNRKHQDNVYAELMTVLDAHTDPTYSQLNELKFMEMCIKESLRIYPSVPVIGRYLEEDIVLKSGDIIPANCSCLLPIRQTHLREDIYPNPKVFDPERFSIENIPKRHPFSYIPFSAGPRNCIGQKFAMLELKTAVCAILKHFTLEPVTTPEDVEILWDIVLRPSGPIYVKFIPRK